MRVSPGRALATAVVGGVVLAGALMLAYGLVSLYLHTQ